MFSLNTGSMLFDVKSDLHNICQRRKSGTEIFTYHPTGPSCIVVDIANTEPYILINLTVQLTQSASCLSMSEQFLPYFSILLNEFCNKWQVSCNNETNQIL